MRHRLLLVQVGGRDKRVVAGADADHVSLL
jgi:hypothetical protein